jgi:hypothetical protein
MNKEGLLSKRCVFFHAVLMSGFERTFPVKNASGFLGRGGLLDPHRKVDLPLGQRECSLILQTHI